MTGQRIVVDPVTRIEGHLRVEAQVSGGKVTEAWSSGTMWRGIEIVVRDRDPREAWLFAQRICGVCTTVHALASVRAVEDALGITPPVNAEYLRQLIALSQYVHDHVVHFYHLQAFDWVDVTSALKADPAKTAALQATLSDYPQGSEGNFAAVKAKLQKFVATGDMGPFTDVRLSHYLVMWLTWGFIIHHVYSAWLLDREERSGEISSIFSGWKNLPRSRVENAPELTPRRPQ